jgi:hypothetical protein
MSRVPLLIAAIVDTSKTLDSVDDVFYGPSPRGAQPGRRQLGVFVGDRGADVSMQPFDGWEHAYTETVDVVCNAVSWSGGTGLEQHVSNVEAILADLADALSSDPSLGGVCERAVIGPRELWTPQVDQQGASVNLAFTVRALSYV